MAKSKDANIEGEIRQLTAFVSEESVMQSFVDLPYAICPACAV